MFAITERLLLRPGWADDAPMLARTIANPRVARNLSQLPWPYREEHAEAFLALRHAPATPNMLIMTRGPRAPELVGGIGLHPDPEGGAALELGYWIAEPHWGKGYATEAARAVVAMARHSLRLKSLQSAYFLDNPASGRVLAKAGFRMTGKVVRRQSLARGETVPAALATIELAGSDADPGNDADSNAMANVVRMPLAA